MKNSTTQPLYHLGASILSGVLLVLSFPEYHFGWLAWIAIVPLLLVVFTCRPKQSFVFSYVCGVLFFAWTFAWMFEVEGYKPLHHIILHLYLGCYVGLFGLACNFIGRRSGLAAASFAAPGIWVLLEYVRSNLGFMSYPSTLLAHSQYLYPSVIQIASTTGAYGVSFLAVAVNTSLAAVIHPLLHKRQRESPPPLFFPTARGRRAVIFCGFTLLAAALLYGHFMVASPIRGKQIKVVLVQGNIDQSKKWDAEHARSIMETYAGLTLRAAEEKPSLIVWPEAATPQAITQNRELYREVAQIASDAGTHLLLGSTSHQKFKEREEEAARELKFFNSAFLISPRNPAAPQRYDKIRLLPFGEYLPKKEKLRWSWIGIPDVGGYLPGEEYTVFRGPGFHFATTICWENIFPDIVRQFVREGAQFIVNIANEAWFGQSAGPYQFLSISVFRAVENRVYVIRSVNTGISCFIDHRGRIVDRVRNEEGKDIFVRGTLTGTVVPLDSRTMYNRFGDMLVWLSLAGTSIVLINALRSGQFGTRHPEKTRSGRTFPEDRS